jgi:O-antigen biosynthesis protein
MFAGNLDSAPANVHNPRTGMGTTAAPTAAERRPAARGKFLFEGAQKLWVKGVTYGTFRPDANGLQFPTPTVVDRDLAAMAAHGINSLRTYTVPPVWLLDVAARHGLRVLVGLPWVQHVAFLDDPALVAQIEDSVRSSVAQCSGHPAVLGYALGNEIPPGIVRWYGARRIERFLRRLYDIGKAEDPAGLFTYVNFPTTEYLQLPFLDLFCFNVYLENRDRLARYLERLQNLAGEKPLLMAEIGLDSRRNGEAAQAESLQWQVETAFGCGCAGAFAFAWTDEWHRGGHDIDDWDFGLTTRKRQPKPALTAVQQAFEHAPFPADLPWPLVTVVVCSYNGEGTIRDTLNGLAALEYPDFEVVVVDDGSTDSVPHIAAQYDVTLISTENRGLSSARNTGWQAATGEIVAYIDDDAYPDTHWLHFLAYTFMTTDYVGVGGPNMAPPGDGPIADCVANSPGGPVHVLVTDTEAEHIPGCNMAFRRHALAAVGGFDPRYRAAGDDVDLCWRLQQRGWKIGFCAAAMDWHHRRNSIRAYWRQQQGYGKAEALLEAKWPCKYNALGHLAWSGRLYGKGLTQALPGPRPRIYQGGWGLALFQSVYEPAPGFLRSLPLMPEWLLVIAGLAALTLLGVAWPPLLWAGSLLALAIAAPIVQAGSSALKADFPTPRSPAARLGLRLITAYLHLLQPIARLKGRLAHGLALWRQRAKSPPVWRVREQHAVWSEEWQEPRAWLEAAAAALREQQVMVHEGGDFDDWDLEVMTGRLGRVRLLLAIEEHGAGREMLRFRATARVIPAVLVGTIAGTTLAALAATQGGWVAAMALGLATAAVAVVALHQTATAMGAIRAALARLREQPAISTSSAQAGSADG